MAQSTYSLSFNGSGKITFTGTPAALNFNGAFAWSGWIKPNSLGTNQAIFCDSDFAQVCLRKESNDKLQWLQNGAGVIVTGSTSLSSATWYHVAVRRFGSSGSWTIKVYLNGVEEASGTTSSNPPSQTALVLAELGSVGAQFWDGLLDDFAFWSSDALAPTQIANIAGTPGVAGSSSLDVGTLSPALLMRMEAGSGTTIADTSGSGNNGTATAGVTWSSDVPTQLTGGGGGGVTAHDLTLLGCGG